mmetsp:Transcript_24690/g.53507  ORF Transcript_24690/g.53507 Transcript_24690/m.53507 type:complete len:461 (-) Transcript_24690:223-1605(-)
MPAPNADLSDLDKIKQSLTSVTSISSLDDVLAAFGLLNMPTAQKYGILFGFLTFLLTVASVFVLLTLGGSWKRIEQQSKSGESATAPDSVTQRKRRPLLLERLLEGREWMLKNNYPEGKETVESGEFTPLTKMLMMVTAEEGNMSQGYEESYKDAYRRCQDKPGGPILGGRPDHRFEAYARAFAGCGNRTSMKHRWSYARMYELMAGTSHDADEKFKEIFKNHPNAIVGRTCRLEPLTESHSRELWRITSGSAVNEHKCYNPDEVWGFLDFGPFDKPQSMLESEVFRLEGDQAGFAIVESITDRLLGAIHLTKDDPKNLNVQMELPIVKPTSDASVEQLEACFLLMDRLFAHGYRRVQMCVDTQDVRGKRLPSRLGMTQEGQIPKHMIVKEANRDSLIYGMLNSDWDKGARAFLYKKLHGAAAEKANSAIVGKEEAAQEQVDQLREKREAEAKEKEKKKA